MADTVPANSSPEAFAEAWKVAACGKRDQQQLRGKVEQERQNSHTSQQNATRINVCEAIFGESFCGSHDVESLAPCKDVEDIPLPKWFTPASANEPTVAALPPGLVVHKTHVESVPHAATALPPGLVQHSAVDTYMQGLVIAAGHRAAEMNMENRKPIPGQCDNPLKVYVPNSMNCRMMNMRMPCKKRVPDWGF
jgi:hypothetical protein